MFEDIVLEDEQVKLLFSLVENVRRVPREKRINFIGSRLSDGTFIVIHPALPGWSLPTLFADLKALYQAGFLDLTPQGTGSYTFDLTPRGLKYYEVEHTKDASVADRIEKPLRSFIDGERFRTAYPSAFDKWSKAESRLWADDSASELSVIGHLCREAMQEFVTSLVESSHPTNVDEDVAHVVARLKAVLSHRASDIPSTLRPFLDSIVSYWGTLNDLIQRQEHAGQKEGQPVTWEDARRIVFHTAIVFLENDRLITTSANPTT